ncbi:MAG TPA: hypothetical protein ENK26_02835 [Gammaproteobacteria bacterium]|nr:hypothetical protein [Gammaproteobacteria bacterium]
MRAKLLEAALDEFHNTGCAIEGAAIVSMDGLIMGSRLPGHYDEDRLAAISSAISSLSTRVASEFERGRFDQILVKGDRGTFLITASGEDAMVVALSANDAKLGMVMHESRLLAEEVQRIL